MRCPLPDRWRDLVKEPLAKAAQAEFHTVPSFKSELFLLLNPAD